MLFVIPIIVVNYSFKKVNNILPLLLPSSNDPNTKAEVLQCLLTFSLATADLGSIIRALNVLVGKWSRNEVLSSDLDRIIIYVMHSD